MRDEFEMVREHYHATGLVDRLRTALAVFGPEDRKLDVQQLAPLDQFHTRGMAATAELAALTGIAAGTSVLDVGAGVGGPARFLAATYGCRVTGIDLSEPFVAAARYLTERTGQQAKVSFEIGSALELPFDDAGFDVVLLQHVAMNIADRPRLYGEIRRVLGPLGRLAIHDIVRRDAEPLYPVPWARTPGTSFLLTPAATGQALERAGFRCLSMQDDTEAARAWAADLRAGGPPPTPHLGLVMGPGFAEVTANLGRNLLEDRIGVLTAVFQVVAEDSEAGEGK